MKKNTNPSISFEKMKKDMQPFVRDAKRYRFLRSRESRNLQGNLWPSLRVTGKHMDAAVDAAMKR